jgi:hypothetical protein
MKTVLKVPAVIYTLYSITEGSPRQMPRICQNDTPDAFADDTRAG